MAERNWTAAQKEALDNLDISLTVSAAAGSGKTTTLAERVIRQVIRDENPFDLSTMLVVTFTNAAAEEVRKKVASALKERVGALAAIPEKDRTEKQEKSYERLERELLTVRTASILTIDAFCNQLLRQNAETVGLAPNFRVGDAPEMELLRSAVFEDLIEGIVRGDLPEVAAPEEFDRLNGALTTVKNNDGCQPCFMEIYDKCQSRIGGVSSLWELIKVYDPERFTAPNDTPFGQFVTTETKELFADAVARLDALIAMTDESLPAEKKIADFLAAERAKIERGLCAKTFDEVRNLFFGVDEKLFEVFPSPRKNATETTDRIKEERDRIKDEIVKLGKTFYLWDADEWREQFAAMHSLLSVFVRILVRFDLLFTAEKRRRNLVDFADLEQLAYRALVGEDGEPTALANSLAATYSAVYIDEYQDVNALQNAIFSAVSRPENRFTVGDIKQCIYAFRGADPSIFSAMKSKFPGIAEARQNGLPAASVFMSENFRCDQPIIDFVNGIFDRLFPSASPSLTYQKQDSLVAGKSGSGSALPEIHLVVAPTADRAEETPEDSDDEIIGQVVGAELTRTELCAVAVADKIEELLAHGKKNDGTPILPSDIAILLRYNKGRADVYAKELSKRGIPTEISEQGDFFLNAEVLLTLSLLSAIDNPRRDIMLAGLLCSPICDFSGDELLRVRRLGGETLYDGVKAAATLPCPTAEVPAALAEKCERFLKNLAKYRKISEGVRSDLFLARLYRETGLLALADANGAKNNLLLLENYAKTYEKNGCRGISGFLSYLKSIIEKDVSFGKGTAEGDTNAVHLLTEHKSKGLEYPVCFVAEAHLGITNKDAKNRMHYLADFGISLRERVEGGLALLNNAPHEIIERKQFGQMYEEELRILYVSLTRARERLFVYGTCKEDDLEKLEKLRAERKTLSSYRAKHLKNFLEMSLISDGDGVAVITDRPAVGEAAKPTGLPETEAETAESTDIPLSDAPTTVREIEKTLLDRFRFAYPNPVETKLPEKLSVSALSPVVLDGSEGETVALTLESYSQKPSGASPALTLAEAAKMSDFEPESADFANDSLQNGEKSVLLPSFYTGIPKNESAKRGIATHTFLQFADFENLKENGAESERERLLNLGFLAKEDADRIRMREIRAFAGSSLLSDLLAAKKIYRELRFHSRLPAELFTGRADFAEELAGKKILVQGVIDCLYEDGNGGLHLIDYKTDRLPKEAIADPALAAKILIEKHALQLSYYSLAIEEMFGRRPLTVEVYSLALGRSVAIPMTAPKFNN